MSNRSIIAIAAVILITATGCGTRYSDSELAQVYKSNRATFTNLIAKLKIDSGFATMRWEGGELFINHALVKDAAVISRYAPSCASLGRKLSISNQGSGSRVFFTLDSSGMTVSGFRKGIAYVEGKPHILVQNTDDGARLHAPFLVSKLIEGNWYIFKQQ